MDDLIDCCLDCSNTGKPEDNCYNGEPCYECPKQQEWWKTHNHKTFEKKQF